MLRALLVFSLLMAASGCGGAATVDNGEVGVYRAGPIRSCLEDAAALVLANSPAYVAGDASGGTFHVTVDGDHATVAFAATEGRAENTARLAQIMLAKLGKGDHVARNRRNVAYWQLDETDAPVRAVEACLETTPTVAVAGRDL